MGHSADRVNVSAQHRYIARIIAMMKCWNKRKVSYLVWFISMDIKSNAPLHLKGGQGWHIKDTLPWHRWVIIIQTTKSLNQNLWFQRSICVVLFFEHIYHSDLILLILMKANKSLKVVTANRKWAHWISMCLPSTAALNIKQKDQTFRTEKRNEIKY